MDNLRVSRKASHGVAALSGLTGIAYRPAKGFKGRDSFSFSFSGEGPVARGVTTMEVTVIVE